MGDRKTAAGGSEARQASSPCRFLPSGGDEVSECVGRATEDRHHGKRDQLRIREAQTLQGSTTAEGRPEAKERSEVASQELHTSLCDLCDAGLSEVGVGQLGAVVSPKIACIRNRVRRTLPPDRRSRGYVRDEPPWRLAGWRPVCNQHPERSAATGRDPPSSPSRNGWWRHLGS